MSIYFDLWLHEIISHGSNHIKYSGRVVWEKWKRTQLQIHFHRHSFVGFVWGVCVKRMFRFCLALVNCNVTCEIVKFIRVDRKFIPTKYAAWQQTCYSISIVRIPCFGKFNKVYIEVAWVMYFLFRVAFSRNLYQLNHKIHKSTRPLKTCNGIFKTLRIPTLFLHSTWFVIYLAYTLLDYSNSEYTCWVWNSLIWIAIQSFYMPRALCGLRQMSCRANMVFHFNRKIRFILIDIKMNVNITEANRKVSLHKLNDWNFILKMLSVCGLLYLHDFQNCHHHLSERFP